MNQKASKLRTQALNDYTRIIKEHQITIKPLQGGSSSSLIILFFFLLLPIQDLPLSQNVTGRLGGIASLPLLLIWFLASLSALNWTDFKNSSVWSILKLLGGFAIYESICSCVLLLTELPHTFRNELLWLKAIKVAITYFIWGIAIFQGYQIESSNGCKIQNISFGVFVAIAGLILIDYYFDSSFGSSNMLFHRLSGYDDSGRVRLFSSEASELASVFTSIGFLAAFSNKSGNIRFIVASIMVILQLLILSRGVIICLSGAVFLGLFFRSQRLKLEMVVIEIISVVLGFLAASWYLVFAVQNLSERVDIDSSVSTRSIITLSSINALISNPFGGGWSGYLYYGEGWLRRALEGLSNLYTDTSLAEILSLLSNEDDRNLAAQNLLTTFVWWGGLPGLFIYLSFCWFIIRSAVKEKDLFVAISGWYLLILLTTCTTTLYDYSSAVLCGVVVNRYIRKI